MPERAAILLFVGPKGAGKTTLGEVLGRQPGVHFLEVEAIARHVLASPDSCADRIAKRDSSSQVNVPPDLIRTMHARSVAFEASWDLEVQKDPPLTPAQILQAFDPLLRTLQPETY